MVEGLWGGGSSGAARLAGGGADARVVGGESRGAHHRSFTDNALAVELGAPRRLEEGWHRCHAAAEFSRSAGPGTDLLERSATRWRGRRIVDARACSARSGRRPWREWSPLAPGAPGHREPQRGSNGPTGAAGGGFYRGW
jgi:hypothetical protein